MKKLVNKDEFMDIFSNLEYRNKLDTILLNFFGLDTSKELNLYDIGKKDITLEFILMINTEVALKILVKDTQRLFKKSKKFYINLSYREVEKYHELLMPCYWEIYIPYCFLHLKDNPKMILIAALFYCQELREIKEILKRLKTFSKAETEDILKIVKENNLFL